MGPEGRQEEFVVPALQVILQLVGGPQGPSWFPGELGVLEALQDVLLGDLLGSAPSHGKH